MSNALEGVAGLQKKLIELGQVASIKILRSAVIAGMNVAKKQAVARAPIAVHEYRLRNGQLVAPGYGQRSIRITTQVSNDGETVSALLGVRKSAFFMVQFVERGTRKMAAHAWLAPSLAGSIPQVEAAFAAKLAERIATAVKGT
jgi:HK97 gp10 family phage protein